MPSEKDILNTKKWAKMLIVDTFIFSFFFFFFLLLGAGVWLYHNPDVHYTTLGSYRFYILPFLASMWVVPYAPMYLIYRFFKLLFCDIPQDYPNVETFRAPWHVCGYALQPNEQGDYFEPSWRWPYSWLPSSLRLKLFPLVSAEIEECVQKGILTPELEAILRRIGEPLPTTQEQDDNLEVINNNISNLEKIANETRQIFQKAQAKRQEEIKEVAETVKKLPTAAELAEQGMGRSSPQIAIYGGQPGYDGTGFPVGGWNMGGGGYPGLVRPQWIYIPNTKSTKTKSSSTPATSKIKQAALKAGVNALSTGKLPNVEDQTMLQTGAKALENTPEGKMLQLALKNPKMTQQALQTVANSSDKGKIAQNLLKSISK